MTRLTRIVTREVLARGHPPLIVELRGDGLWTREKGRRTWYGPLGYGWLHLQAARFVAEERRSTRRASRRRWPR